MQARAYHAPETLEYNPGVMSKDEENAYYQAMLDQIDRNINIKNGVCQVPIETPPAKGKR